MRHKLHLAIWAALILALPFVYFAAPPATGPSGIDQVSVAAFDATNHALRVNFTLGAGTAVTPNSADQVFTGIYDATDKAIYVNCVAGCSGGSFTAATDLSGSSSSQNVIGFDFGGSHFLLSTTAPSSGQCLLLSGTTIAGGSCGTASAQGGTYDTQYNAGSGAFGAATAPTGNGVWFLNSNVTSGAAVAPSWRQLGTSARSVTGTTDTVLFSDVAQLVDYQGSSAVAVSLPTATTLGNTGFETVLRNLTTGSGTAVTVAPATWTINGGATLTIAQGQSCTVAVDPNSSTNWQTSCYEGPLSAGSSNNLAFTRSASGLTIDTTAGTFNLAPQSDVTALNIAPSAAAPGASPFTLYQNAANAGTTYTVTSPGCTNATPIVCALSSVTNFPAFAQVTVSGVGGNTAANGNFSATLSGSTITLNASTGNGAWTSGGTVIVQPLMQIRMDASSHMPVFNYGCNRGGGNSYLVCNTNPNWAAGEFDDVFGIGTGGHVAAVKSINTTAALKSWDYYAFIYGANSDGTGTGTNAMRFSGNHTSIGFKATTASSWYPTPTTLLSGMDAELFSDTSCTNNGLAMLTAAGKICLGAGGSGTPGGSSLQYQINNASTFGGSTALTNSLANGTGAVQINQISTGTAAAIVLPAASATADLMEWIAPGQVAPVNGICASTVKCSEWIDASGNFNFLGNTATYGPNTTASWLHLYGGSTGSAGAYILGSDSAGGHNTYLYFDPTTAGQVSLETSVVTGASTAANILCTNGNAQCVTANKVQITVANAGTTGTTANTLTKLTGAPSAAVIAASTDTAGIVGITIAGAGLAGNATIQTSGLVSCVFENATTAGDYVTIGSTTGGDCHDTGSSAYPTSGAVIGRVLSTNAAAGTYQIDLFAPEVVKNGGGVTSFTGDGALLSNSGSTGAVTATLANAAAFSVWGNTTSTSAAPGYTSAPSVSSITLNGSTSGSFPLTVISTGTTLNIGSTNITAATSGVLSAGSLTLSAAGGSGSIHGASAGQALAISSGLDSANSTAAALGTLRGQDITTGSTANTRGGHFLIRGGDSAGSVATTEAGSVFIRAGQATGATQGIQGLISSSASYVKGATSTQWLVECATAAMTASDCTASSVKGILGVAEAVNTNTTIVTYSGQTFVTATAAVTIGDNVCLGATNGEVTDSATGCAVGTSIGRVLATSGTFLLGDGTSATATTTLPLIELVMN